MTALHAYLPQDRLCALARGESLPDRMTGSALFADISGFTPLTEKLTRDFGVRRGIEELAHRINNVYDAMIDEIDRLDGSVVSFAADPRPTRDAGCCGLLREPLLLLNTIACA